VLFTLKSRARRDFLDAGNGFFQRPAGGLDAKLFHRFAGRPAGLLPKYARECAGAHSCSFGQTLHTQITAEIILHPGRDIFERPVFGRLQ
jgi:hypothetical protein